LAGEASPAGETSPCSGSPASAQSDQDAVGTAHDHNGGRNDHFRQGSDNVGLARTPAAQGRADMAHIITPPEAGALAAAQRGGTGRRNVLAGPGVRGGGFNIPAPSR